MHEPYSLLVLVVLPCRIMIEERTRIKLRISFRAQTLNLSWSILVRLSREFGTFALPKGDMLDLSALLHWKLSLLVANFPCWSRGLCVLLRRVIASVLVLHLHLVCEHFLDVRHLHQIDKAVALLLAGLNRNATTHARTTKM